MGLIDLAFIVLLIDPGSSSIKPCGSHNQDKNQVLKMIKNKLNLLYKHSRGRLIVLHSRFFSIFVQMLKLTINRVYPLERIVEEHRYLEPGRKKENVVITVTY